MLLLLLHSPFPLIRVAGEEISRDLMQLLRRRLDDAVLDNLTTVLKRNPMYKLTSEDIQVSRTHPMPRVQC